MVDNFTELVLSCKSWQEAQAVADALFAESLVSSVELLPVSSSGYTHEVKLIVQTQPKYFAKIEDMAKKLHSYKTPKLHALRAGNPAYESRLKG